MTQQTLTLSDQDGPAMDAPDVLRWHASWAGAVALETIALYFWAHASLTLIFALLIGSTPALGALVLSSRREAGARLAQLLLWTGAAVVAASLSGGMTGPLGAWCLTPLAAASVLGGSRRLAVGAALAALAAALVALAQAIGLTQTPPPGSLDYIASVLGMASALFALATGLIIERRRSSRRIDAEAAVKDALDTILEGQPHWILWLDLDGQVKATFGRPPSDIAADRLMAGGLSMLGGPDSQADLQLVLTEAAEHRRASLAFPMAGAGGVWLSLDLQALPAGGLVGVVRDVTVERERERDLERAKLDAESLNISKSRFLANMSHELRTPLNAIMGFSDIMRARLFGALPGKYAEYADLIHDAGSHLLDLITDVLDMSKIEAARYELRLERFDAREPIAAALRLMRLQADDVGVKLRGILPGEGLLVDGDRRAIKQMGLNLISNALKFTPRGGEVTVSLGAIAGALELSVVDTGVGIAREDLARLGRPFEQAGDPRRQSQGTGLGLSLVRAFAELHGGEMVIESQLGEGTAVTVRLPVIVTPAAAQDAEPLPADPDPPAHEPTGGRSGGAQVIPFKPQR